jgi:hypothetical protein
MGGLAVAHGSTPAGGLGANCIACDGDLYYVPDCYPLIFRCANAHCLTLEDLLSHDHRPGAAEPVNLPQSTLDAWVARARILHELSGTALRNGHAFMAADFQEAANRIEGWVSTLRSLLAKLGRSSPAQD